MDTSLSSSASPLLDLCAIITSEVHLLTRTPIKVDPLAPATDRQKAFMDANEIAYSPDCTKLAAYQLIKASLPPSRGTAKRRNAIKKPNSPARGQARGYLTKAEFEGQIETITARITAELTKQFLADTGKAYDALALARDDTDPKVRGEALRAAIEHLNRVMGKVADKQEHKGEVTLNVKYDNPQPGHPPSDPAR